MMVDSCEPTWWWTWFNLTDVCPAQGDARAREKGAARGGGGKRPRQETSRNGTFEPCKRTISLRALSFFSVVTAASGDGEVT